MLAFDLAAARELAAFRVPERTPLDDALLAAVAQANGMTVATRIVRDFEPLGVPVVDPWAS
ncbi:type II toxin-antitoxin system VapC family toxin [Tsukamurella spumae]|uniref:Type II toxin-antitoxin system VapC family toxin n=1 Tax=Tsukamurella spumae TaxID=44753 RepID=A0A846WV35_9ACTN|nr:type II toxin-antitoxin system VapC family toxin [Tsukamurella spumae]NKY16873.1 type II toxin-antitoxin system VapC family toxin [Tsukamurella spumae]